MDNRSQDALLSWLHAIPIPVMCLASDQRIAFMNRLATNIFGPDLEGRHYLNALRQPELLTVIEDVFRGQETGELRCQLSALQQERVYDVSVSRTQDGFLLLSFQDKSDLIDALNIRRDFVANVSHELKTPLTALLGFIETLSTVAKDDSVARAQFLQIMQAEALRMDRLVADLLSLSKVEAMERQRPTDNVRVKNLITQAVTALAPLLDSQNVTLSETIGDPTCQLVGEADQLLQVILNLLENAIKYGGRDQEVQITVTAGIFDERLRTEVVVIEVKDNGPGIDPVHIPRLTERFYRIDDHRSRALGGTGLGLAIVKHIVSRHRGRLTIESEENEGSTFRVSLPMGE